MHFLTGKKEDKKAKKEKAKKDTRFYLVGKFMGVLFFSYSLFFLTPCAFVANYYLQDSIELVKLFKDKSLMDTLWHHT